MRRYLEYFKYIIRHKWLVLLECMDLGIEIRGILHDISKFRPSEFIPYAKHFYNEDGSKKQHVPDDDFDAAFLHHLSANKHHWQYWVKIVNPNEMVALDMPEVYIREMVADWNAMSRAQGNLDAKTWYQANKDKMILSIKTRVKVEEMLGVV